MRRSQQTSNSTLEVLLNTFRQQRDNGVHRSGGARILTATLIVVSVALASSGPIAAEQPSTTQPSLASKLNPMNWKMPEFLVPNKDQERIVERKNTLASDIKTTASQSWQRTKTALNPARLNPMNLFATADTDQPAKKKEPGFFSSMFSPSEPEPEERVATVNQFLNQERP